MKTCNTCGENKPKTEFHKNGKYRRRNCKTCQNSATARWDKENPDNCRKRQIKYLYGLTWEEYCDLRDSQDNKCTICGVTFIEGDSKKKPCIDHDHAMEPEVVIRGILCNQCNLGISYFNDDPYLTMKATDYLRR